jgi:hypothetical protein
MAAISSVAARFAAAPVSEADSWITCEIKAFDMVFPRGSRVRRGALDNGDHASRSPDLVTAPRFAASLQRS